MEKSASEGADKHDAKQKDKRESSSSGSGSTTPATAD
jgi:hypothetical protein